MEYFQESASSYFVINVSRVHEFASIGANTRTGFTNRHHMCSVYMMITVPYGAVQVSITTSLQQNFTEDLLEESSDAYRQLEEKFRDGMMGLFNNGSLSEYFYSLEVNGFRSGSVVVYYTVTLVGLPEDLNTNAEFQALLREEIQRALNNGNLSGLPADSSTVAVIEINFLTTLPQTNQSGGDNSNTACSDQPCMNGGTCEVSEGGGFMCRCPSPFTGDRCQEVLTCPPLDPLVDGVVSCTMGNEVSSRCTHTCNSPFFLLGLPDRVCQEDQRWTNVAPLCEMPACPLLVKIENSTMSCSRANADQSICTFRCVDGFTLEQGGNLLARICRNGQWTGSPPSCILRGCPPLETPPNGMIACSDMTNVGSSCITVCDSGFRVSDVQNEGRRCLETGLWTGSALTCIEETVISCRTLIGTLVGGEIRCTNGEALGSNCLYTCNEGLVLSVPSLSSSVRTCGPDGQWSGLDLTCAAVTCPIPNEIPNGALESCTNGVLLNSVCTYSCQTGFNLIGSSTRVCQLTGAWDVEEPTCQAVTCPIPNEIPNLVLESCTNGVLLNSVCTYSCQTGFNLIGSSVRVCQLTGAWDVEGPTCQAVTCPTPNEIPNGALSCSNGTLFGSVCTYSCQIGFNLIGSSTRVCQSSGAWDVEEQACQGQECLPLPPISNGDVICLQGSEVGSVCIYTCNEGYFSVPRSVTRTCQNNLQWSGEAPTCQPITCPDLTGSLSGGTVTCTDDNNFQSMCTYSCSEGFISNTGQDGERTCEAVGQWSGEIIGCFVTQCPALTVPANGNIFCTNGNMINSVCTFTCQNGFAIVGNSQLVCQVGGVWPGEPPFCQRVTCPDLGAIPDGVAPSCTDGFFAFSVCTYSCNEGFQIVPEIASRTCDPQTGTWSGIQPTCEQVTCPVLNAIANGVPPVCTDGFLAGSVCTYSCNAGFQIVLQSASRVCDQQTGMWTGVQPTCEQVTCPSLLPIPNGNLQVCTNSFNFGSVCMYSCNDGFRFESTGSRTCTDTGEWSIPEPSCVQVTCPSLLPIPNGNLQVCTNNFNFGSVCMYSCNDGFRFETTGSRTCTDTGEWSIPEPSCVQVTCPGLGAIPNAAAPICTDSFFAGSVCTYSCNEGFQIASLNQGASRTCDPQTGSWIGAEPVCEQVPVAADCEQLPEVANAILQCTDGIAPNSICTYTCNDGWMLAAGQDGTRTCQVDGTWSNQQPVCEVICGTTPAFIQPRVINGELSSPRAWPWLASLRTSSGSHQCGGTLIDREWVLTAAHCIVDSITMIILGDLLLDVQTEFHQEFGILPENRFPHPDYNDFSQRNDIALIRLPRPAVYNDFVRPLCLNFNMEEELAFPNNCFVAGWGFTEEDAGVASNELYEAEIPFFDRGVCEQLFFIVGITETQFCAGFTVPGPDACQGDSGGPYMCYDSSSDTWRDVGVVSFGIGCGDGQTPGVYTRISQYMDFVTSFITNN